MLPRKVQLIEVGPRDGLQREERHLSVAEKVSFITDLVNAGFKRIQVTAFVHPRYVPQMADAEEVCERLPRTAGIRYSGLALNGRGVERAYIAGLTEIDISISASDAHSRRNANLPLDRAVEQFEQMYRQARAYDMHVRGGIQCAFGYQRVGDVERQTVLRLASHFLALGVDELALADSSGIADPLQVSRLLQELMPLRGETPVILHLHDTRGMGLANLFAALQCGVSHFDTAVGGLGGCPFIEGAAGNIASEDTAFMLNQMGIETGIDVLQLATVARQLKRQLGKSDLPGKLHEVLAPEKGMGA